jgi:hypothetical protein
LLFQINVTTIIGVKITFDSKKDADNVLKHHVSLAEAAFLDWGNALSGQISDMIMVRIGK